MVASYQTRKVLKELGYTNDGANLSCLEADIYKHINNEYNRVEREMHKEQMTKAKRRRR